MIHRFRSDSSTFQFLVYVIILIFAMDQCYRYGYDQSGESGALLGGEAQVRLERDAVLDRENHKRVDPEVDFMPNIDHISWSPRAQIYYNFFTAKECEELVAFASPRVERSMVVDNEHPGQSKVSSARTSSGYWFKSGDLPELQEKADRQIEDWTHIPKQNGESFYALRYELGQQYLPHTDYFPEEPGMSKFIGRSGNRVATVLIYLHSPEEGGHTVFPNAPMKVEANATAGTALLFWDYLPSHHPDPYSLHGGNPVIKGVKWSMTRWIRMRKF